MTELNDSPYIIQIFYGQIYEEAESNANEFALTCTGPTREGGLGLMTMEEPYMHASRMACIAEA